MVSMLTVDFLSGSGARLTQLTVFGDGDLSSLKENGRYEYELDSPLYSLREIPGVLSHSRISHDNERGLIEPGITKTRPIWNGRRAEVPRCRLAFC
jgi:hypothetical protein